MEASNNSELLSRRKLLKRGLGLGMIAISVAGVETVISAREAYANALPLKTLTKIEGELLAALGEALVPGARAAGVVQYLDYHLGVPPNENGLVARYFEIEPPYLPFYRQGVVALESFSQHRYKKAFTELPVDDQNALLSDMYQHFDPATLAGWTGSVSPFLFYQCVRSDSLDLVYGTPEGFETLGIPYMAHIMPPSTW